LGTESLENLKKLFMLLAIVSLFSGGIVAAIPVFADPPPEPPPGTILPNVFCFRITDIRADKTDPENDRFIFEFEVLNWTGSDAFGVEISLAQPDQSGVRFVGAGIDSDGRPLFLEDVNLDTVIDAADNEDLNSNGLLDAGEDINGDGRLTNDPIPGNQQNPNPFTVDSVSDTRIVWEDLEAPANESGGVFNSDLIGAGGTAASNALIPGFNEGSTTIDSQGNVSPIEAIDDGNNVVDGFRFTVDGLDPGETFQFNWSLTVFGQPLGTSFGGNDFGFGVVIISRVDAGGLPGPVYIGNSGVQQTGLEFFDSVYIVPDPAVMAAEFGAAITAPFVNPTDNVDNFVINAIIIDDTDTTPPVITASLVPLCGEDDEGFFRVEFSATDENLASVTAQLNGITVSDGQIVELELDDEFEIEFDDGILEIEANSFSLIVSASDSKGNSGTVEVIPSFDDLVECDDDEKDDDDDEKDDDEEDEEDDD